MKLLKLISSKNSQPVPGLKIDFLQTSDTDTDKYDIDIDALLANTEISTITQNSKNVTSDTLFAALKGVSNDGANFIPDSIKNGASCILCDLSYDITNCGNYRDNNSTQKNIVFLRHENPRLVLAKIAANFYAPAAEIVVAVTGTNGKTSTAYFCKQIWQLLGKKSASIGTIGVVTDDLNMSSYSTGSMTTPDPIKLHEILHNLHLNNIDYVAMEASSHGLDQYRLDGVEVKAAAFTNITRDHLDYHGTFENYFNAKLRLFKIMHEGVAVINADIEEADKILKFCKDKNHKILSLGRRGKYIEIFNITKTRSGQQIAFQVIDKLYTVNTSLVGEFQAYNLLTALALVVGSGANIDEAVATLSMVRAVPGRMQGINFKDEALARIYVDYAHTPDALSKALNVLKPYANNNLWVVFGCGGDRDKGKRPQMGEIAANIADKIVITDDNPRSEDPKTIRQEIIAKCPIAIEIADRREAINYAITNMQKDDILLIAGKGHEKSQIIGNQKLSHDDVLIAEEFAGETEEN